MLKSKSRTGGSPQNNPTADTPPYIARIVDLTNNKTSPCLCNLSRVFLIVYRPSESRSYFLSDGLSIFLCQSLPNDDPINNASPSAGGLVESSTSRRAT